MTAPSLEAILHDLRGADLLLQCPEHLPPITDITMDSRRVHPGSLFIAVRGSTSDGHDHIPDAVAKGASALVGERPMATSVPCIVVRDSRRAAHIIGATWYGHPASRLSFCAVTGTNGKTTTTAILRYLLNAAGTAGSIGTLGAFSGSGVPVESTAGSLTTPGPLDMPRTLRALADSGAEWVVMEASSHALDQGRLDGVRFTTAAFTNLTRDHLDYHGTMERYRDAKLLLLALVQPDGTVVVNADEPAWAGIAPRQRVLTFGTSAAADVRGLRVQPSPGGTSFLLQTDAGAVPVRLPLLGEFNVANALAAAASALASGVDLSTVAERLATLPQVPGRMERIAGTPCVILRDYAHTPDALERALQTVRGVTPGRILLVFGCGGDRDRGKRPIMGAIASEYADVAIVTSDNPRTEDPEAIMADIVGGMNSGQRVTIADRRDAIAWAVREARPDDVILLAGKGHETYQVIGMEKVPFDERAIVRDLGAR